MNEVQKTPCDWCGKRIARGYHGNSKSLFMRNYRFYCSETCREADSLPDWTCFPAFLIPFTIIMTLLWLNAGLFVSNLLGTIASVGFLFLVSISPLWKIRSILKIRKELPKNSNLE